MQSNRVLFISYDGLTDPLGQSQILPYLVELNKLNYEITILSTEKDENFLKNKQTIELICDKEGIKWDYITYTKKPPVLATIKDISLLLRKVKSLHAETPFNILHCRSYISALVGLKMKKKLGIKFLFDMRGFWADERVDGGIWSISNPIFKKVYNFFKKKEKEYLLNADHTVSLTHNGRDEIMSWEFFKASKKDNISVIPCCADLNHFDFNKHKDNRGLKASLSIDSDDEVICYLGSIGTWYMMEEMMDYFSIHLKKYPKTIFLWITKDEPDYIIEKATEKGIENNIRIKASERFGLPDLLSICSASIFFIKPLFSKKASSPTKMAELLGMGIPLICNTNVGDTDGIVLKEGVGVVINDFNETSYQEAVDQFKELKMVPREKLREVAKQYFSLEEGVTSYDKIYESLLEN